MSRLNNHPRQAATPDAAAATRGAMTITNTGALALVELFYSLQGEGLRSGEPTVFARFAGCNCDCWFCDTDFRVRQAPSASELLSRIQTIAPGCKWLCLTGGEPTIHDLQELCDIAHDAGYKIQMETNGSIARPSWKIDHITVSPKELQGARLDPWCFEHAAEFKYVVTDAQDLAYALENAARHSLPASLQPNALAKESVKLAIDAVLESQGRLRLSLQTHKIVGII